MREQAYPGLQLVLGANACASLVAVVVIAIVLPSTLWCSPPVPAPVPVDGRPDVNADCESCHRGGP